MEAMAWPLRYGEHTALPATKVAQVASPDASGRRGPGPRLPAVVAAVMTLALTLGGGTPGTEQPPRRAIGTATGTEAGEASVPRHTTRGQLLPDAPTPTARWEETSDAATTEVGVPDADDEESTPPTDVVETTPEGFSVIGGAATAGSGERRTFTVEVEAGLEAHADHLFETVGSALLDAESSWARDHALAQVEDPAEADVRVVLASPRTVDEWCATAGLDTAGSFSCWDGERAMLNRDRWRHGVEHVADLELYRAYLVNHEVGHGLGHGHVECPGPGAPAPVMMQQTLRLDGCEPNPWPYP